MTAPTPLWARQLEEVRDDPVSGIQGVDGGDIGDSHLVEFASGERLFVKHYADASEGRCRAEARGLAQLAQTQTLRVATPIAWGQRWLALEWIEQAPPAPDFALRLGRGLARLHAATPDFRGLEIDNWIGQISQPNGATADWPSFYAERRIRPLQQKAGEAGLLRESLSRDLDQALEHLPDLIGDAGAPSLLHGDLWSGNVLSDEQGHPCLVDPAVYAGHREVDLAMMRLFGGFPPSVFDAYHEADPMQTGWEQRVPLYQLYPLLVHLCLFGQSYEARLTRTLEKVLTGRA
jgi:fructosamine-3-kinase